MMMMMMMTIGINTLRIQHFASLSVGGEKKSSTLSLSIPFCYSFISVSAWIFCPETNVHNLYSNCQLIVIWRKCQMLELAKTFLHNHAYSVKHVCAGWLPFFSKGGDKKGRKINSRTRSENPQSSRLMYKLHLRVNVFSIFTSSQRHAERVRKKFSNKLLGAPIIVFLFVSVFRFLINAAKEF